jgi:hypothetical protein
MHAQHCMERFLFNDAIKICIHDLESKDEKKWEMEKFCSKSFL